MMKHVKYKRIKNIWLNKMGLTNEKRNLASRKGNTPVLLYIHIKYTIMGWTVYYVIKSSTSIVICCRLAALLYLIH